MASDNPHPNPQPPRWAARLLEFYCRDGIQEDLQGDLYEYFERNVKNKGLAKARWIYILDVIKFIRPYTIQPPRILDSMAQFLTMGNYVKTSVRNLGKNWSFSAINVIGLSISISVGLLIITMVNELASYDQFHNNANRIFRIKSTYQYLDQDRSEFASTSILAGKRLINEVEGVQDAVILRRHFNGVLDTGEKKLPARGIWASDRFFQVFSFPLIRGNPATALTELNSIVLTESLAGKLFGEIDPIGKLIGMGEEFENFQVTGVMKDVPNNSHLQFEMLGSFSTIDEANKTNTTWSEWTYMWTNYAYMKLGEGVEPATVQAALDRISTEENSREEHTTIEMTLQPMTDIAMGENLSNDLGRNMDQKILLTIAMLSLIVILSACFNYSNLSIARSLRRSREVGVRKVIGATRAQIFYQFILESVLVSVIALAFSYLIFSWLKPQFLRLDPYLNRLLDLEVNAVVVIQFIALGVVTGVVAGFLPSLFFSKMSPNAILRSGSSVKLFKGLTVRKVLIVFQFTLSMAFIVAAMLIHKQYRYALSFDLGYNTENVLNIFLKGNTSEVLMNELGQLSEVEEMSSSLMLTSVGDTYGNTLKYRDPADSLIIHYNAVDANYLPLHGHKLLAGTNFTKPFRENDSIPYQIIVSRKLIHHFGISDPQKAVGEMFKIRNTEAEVVGVIEDFQYTTIENEVRPFLFRNMLRAEAEYINLKVRTEDVFSTMSQVEAIWKQVDDAQPLQASFYSDDITEIYMQYSIMVKIIGYLAFLAITIAVLGLLGMVIYTTESRLKEISIRKVMGATPGNLIFLLGRGFMLLLVISALLGLPTTYYLIDHVVFASIANKATYGFLEMFGGAVIVFAVALSAISIHTIRAVRTNPAVTLRNE